MKYDAVNIYIKLLRVGKFASGWQAVLLKRILISEFEYMQVINGSKERVFFISKKMEGGS